MNYKPFSIEQAKAGKPVITRDGRPARIVCFDRKSKYPLFGFVGKEDAYTVSWKENGRLDNNASDTFDLFMAPEEKTVWVNLWRKDGRITTGEDTYGTKEAATDGIISIISDPDYVGTFPITYQE